MVPNPPISKTKRPFGVTLLIFLVSGYSALGWLGFLEVLRHWDFLQGLPLNVPVLYLALRGLFWGLTGLSLIWGLWVGRRWAWVAVQFAAVFYAIHYWMERLFLADVSAIASRWPFAVSLTALSLAYTFVVLQLRMSRSFFEVTYVFTKKTRLVFQ